MDVKPFFFRYVLSSSRLINRAGAIGASAGLNLFYVEFYVGIEDLIAKIAPNAPGEMVERDDVGACSELLSVHGIKDQC